MRSRFSSTVAAAWALNVTSARTLCVTSTTVFPASSPRMQYFMICISVY